MSVTTTSIRQGKFEARFWHRVFEEEVGRVKGHFGPLNTYVHAPLPSTSAHHDQNLTLRFSSPGILFQPGSPCIRQGPHMHPEGKTGSFVCITLTRATSRHGHTAK